jgi:predicted transcriptional regulator
MSAEVSIFADDEEADARRYDQALADIEAGRLIPNDEICAWLETWGTPDEKPAPASWFK